MSCTLSRPLVWNVMHGGVTAIMRISLVLESFCHSCILSRGITWPWHPTSLLFGSVLHQQNSLGMPENSGMRNNESFGLSKTGLWCTKFSFACRKFLHSLFPYAIRWSLWNRQREEVVRICWWIVGWAYLFWIDCFFFKQICATRSRLIQLCCCAMYNKNLEFFRM